MLTQVIRFHVRPEWVERWLSVVDEFTQAARAEEANAWFWWSRCVDNPGVFFLMEGHRDGGCPAGGAVRRLVPAIQREWPRALLETPRVLKTTVEGEGWTELDLLPVIPG
ncbi:putative quinol monooxygenase [Actinokineospora bangkokensis]|uniref:Antibiotic biosynthesis monooxygenase n=1 Tax=Actinokineospora bangkokensis TaxID=1193682 RepID=A0A1Q9LLY7_9PSEU|nr:antibiotic biosynthesis monooxygenase [Actinokineospora bangkokensis]OLR93014.1 antibiotic biosynthesis monooxygenase [Actinokineospora bangkokensis]